MSALDRAKHIADKLGVNPNGTQGYNGNVIGPDTAAAAALVGIQHALTAIAEQGEPVNETRARVEHHYHAGIESERHVTTALRERGKLAIDALTELAAPFLGRADDAGQLAKRLVTVVSILDDPDVTVAVQLQAGVMEWARSQA